MAPYGPRQLHCILLDPRTGRIVARHEWSVLRSLVAFLPTRGGHFVVRTSTGLTVYSPTLEPLKELGIPLHSPAAPYDWAVSTTPTRRLVVLVRHTDSEMDVLWLDSTTLSQVRRWRSVTETFDSGWDSLHFSDDLLANPLRWGVQVRGRTGGWQTIYNANRLPDWLDAAFVSTEALLVCQESLAFVVRSNGQYVLARSLGSGNYCHADDAQASAEGNRFAIPVFRTEGVDNETLGLAAHPVLKRVLIYDVPAGRPVGELDTKGLSLRSASAFALSPDGSRLALLRNGAIELFRLPSGLQRREGGAP
jgi:hypothetical protein